MKRIKWGNDDTAKALRQALRRSVSTALVGLVNVATALGFVYVSKQLIDTVTGVADHPLNRGIALLCALMALRLLSSVLYVYMEGKNTAKTQMALRRGFFDRLMRMRWDGTDTFHSGDAVNRVEEDVRVVVDFVTISLPGFVMAAFQLLFASAFVYLMSPMLLGILVVFTVVAALLGLILYRPVRRLTRTIRKQDGEIQSHMQESLQNRINAMVLFGIERMTERLDKMQGGLYDNMLKRLGFTSFAQFCMRIGFMAGYTVAFIYGVLGIKSGAITFGVMTALLQLVGQVQRPLTSLTRLFPSAVRYSASLERLDDINRCPQEPSVEDIRMENAPEIRVEGLHFAYPGQAKPVFDGFSAVFPAGAMTAVVGETGVGKTTLVRLLLALLEPTQGSLTLDGTPISVATRCNFMYVPQSNSIISGTIRENLLLVKPTATEEEMREALHTAVADFVFDLPNGLDTPCYERGGGLSEGQARRVAVACALLHQGNVMILDEATAALDGTTESLLLDNLKRYCAGRKTVVFVSHSESVWAHADHVLRMDER